MRQTTKDEIQARREVLEAKQLNLESRLLAVKLRDTVMAERIRELVAYAEQLFDRARAMELQIAKDSQNVAQLDTELSVVKMEIGVCEIMLQHDIRPVGGMSVEATIHNILLRMLRREESEE